MKCNCKATESVLAILVIVFSFWEVTYSKWIIIIVAVLLLLHALSCKNCANCDVPVARGNAKKRR